MRTPPGLSSLFLPILGLLLAAMPTRSETYYVRPGGDDRADGKTVAAAFGTLRRVAQVLGHGDQVVLAPGSHNGGALFAERFAADGSAMSVRGDEDGKLMGQPPGPVIVEADPSAEAALRFSRFRHLRLSGLTFRGRGQGLLLDDCQNVHVERCTFRGLGRGLAAVRVTDLRIECSVFARCTTGVVLRECVRARVAHVSVAGSPAVGLLALACGEGEVVNSLFVENNSNFIADGLTAATWHSDHNVLHGPSGPWGNVPLIAKVYEWNAATSQDRHSVHVVPAFVNPQAYDLHISPEVGWGGGLPGINVGRELTPPVTRDRDGKPLRVREGTLCVGAYDYPDPRPAESWVRLKVALERGSRQSAGVYRDDGTLVRTLLADAAGVRDLWWDGRDDQGQTVAAGKYEVKILVHDARVRDDGSFGDNGSLLGAYNCDNANRVAPLPDGGFLISTFYDEAGFAVRRYSASGQPVVASNLAEKEFHALAVHGDDAYAVLGAGPQGKLVRLTFSGERIPLPSGANALPLYGSTEKTAAVAGLAVVGGRAYVAVAGLNVVRVFDLADGGRKADLPVPDIGDIAAGPSGGLWVLSGTSVLSLASSGEVLNRLPTGLHKPRYLAVSKDRLAVVDPTAGRIAILDHAGKVVRILGRNRPKGEWMAVHPEMFREPRGCAFLADGRLVLTEQQRVRILWPDTGRLSHDLISTFVDTAVVHPMKPEYVYTALGCFRVDPKTGAWTWVVEEPRGMTRTDPASGKITPVSYGTPAARAVLGGRPFIGYTPNEGVLHLFDVSDPLQPRLSLTRPGLPGIYQTFAFTKGSDLLLASNEGLSFRRVRFKGLDADNKPRFDFANPIPFGPARDPVTKRLLSQVGAVAGDTASGDIYYLAVTAYNNKMVPGWGADGTGVGKSSADGAPRWFAPSSGGNYMALDTVHDGKTTWVLAAKSFGGQVDVFDEDGLRLATGAWSWPCAHQFGFVDVRYGLRGYLRPDGKVGAYLEDDSVGRLGRARIDGLDTVRKSTSMVEWSGSTPAGPIPDAHSVRGKELERKLIIPRVPSLKVDGQWSAWAKAGVTPQMLVLPTPTYKRTLPDDLFQTFRKGTALGALAHDGKSLLVTFVVAADTPHFDADKPETMWMFDGIELWLEEEQLGLGLLKDGSPALYKFRHHDRKGKEFAANYPLPRENVWAARLPDLAAHPLGGMLAEQVGVSLQGKSGYAVMARIPFEEVKLVGGIAGRSGKEILDLKGTPGEVLRVAVNIGGIVVAGHEQDFKVGWPSSVMFADPTRSYPFILGK